MVDPRGAAARARGLRDGPPRAAARRLLGSGRAGGVVLRARDRPVRGVDASTLPPGDGALGMAAGLGVARGRMARRDPPSLHVHPPGAPHVPLVRTRARTRAEPRAASGAAA